MAEEHNVSRAQLTKENIQNLRTTLKSQFVDLDDESSGVKCLFCESVYVLPTNEKDLLTHLYNDHHFIIGDVWKIASLKSYLHYWRVKFKDEPFTNFCSTLLMDCTPDGTPSHNEPYFLLSNCTSEDKTLRDELHLAKLEWVLAEQERERSDTTFKRGCMLCKTEFSGLRSIYLKHLSEKHNIQLGKPENLVFIDKLLDTIQSNIENLICIYCEKRFKDRAVLREHMRKKLHKRINPCNKSYDKFYIINYLEMDRSHKRIQKNELSEEEEHEINFSSGNEDEDSWSDWKDENISITCLFCKKQSKEFDFILQHMKSDHSFSFEEVTKDIDFYKKVKIVNYIRKQIHVSQCILCDLKCNNVVEHMNEHDHFKLPNKIIWNQPEFYFPMYENDSFLYNLDTSDQIHDDSDINSDNFRQTVNITETT